MPKTAVEARPAAAGFEVRGPLAWLASERARAWGMTALAVAAALVAWELLARKFALYGLFPTATTTLARFWELLTNGTLLNASVASLLRILVGFAVGSALGVVLGLMLGASPVARAANEPFVHFFRFVPPIAWFAPLLLWLGSGEVAKIALIVYTTVFLVGLNTMAGVQAIPKDKIRMAGAFGASRRQTFAWVTIPASAPYIFNGMRIAMGNSFMTIVAAEMLAAQEGLGYLVNRGLLFLNTATVFSAIITLGLLGFATDRLFQWLIRRFGGRFTPQQSVRVD